MTKDKIRHIGVLSVIMAVFIALAGVAVADDFIPDEFNAGPDVNLDVVWVKINGDIIEDGDALKEDFLRGDELEVKVKIQAYTDIKNVEIMSAIYGNDNSKISDTTDVFDVENGTRYTRTLTLELPDRMDQDDYDLRVIVADRSSAMKVYNYNLKIDAPKNLVVIKDITFSPEGQVEAGRALLGVVRIKNVGEKDEDSVKIRISIPALGISATDYIDELEAEDSISSEELYFRVPASAESGEYEAKIEVWYDDGDEKVSATETIKVVGLPKNIPIDDDEDDDEPESAEKTIIEAGPEVQDTARGEGGVIYPITITNDGSKTKTYTLSVTGTGTWAETKMSPSNLLMLEAGQTDTVYVYVAAKENAAMGAHVFHVSVKSGSETLKQVQFTANVVEGTGKPAVTDDKVMKIIEVALVVLVIILIVLGLVLAFTKMREKEVEESDDEELSGQTYY